MYGGAFAALAALGDGEDADAVVAEVVPGSADGDDSPALSEPGAEHPFVCDPGDHAETPAVAFEHIAPLLRRLAHRLGPLAPGVLKIYDPYFCKGTCKLRLGELGFSSVYNRNEDCYAAWAQGRAPPFDVLVSNPPYTGDHLERVFAFAWACGKPFMLLVPAYVARKSWMLSHLDAAAARGGAACRPAYLGPAQAYIFEAPSDRADVRHKRAAGADGAGGTLGAAGSPAFAVKAAKFQAVWVISLGASHQAPILEWWRRNHGAATSCVLANTPEGLPQLAQQSAARLTPAERRWKRKHGTDEEVGLSSKGAKTSNDPEESRVHGADEAS